MSLVARQQVSTQFETLTKTVKLTATTVCCTAQIIHCCCKFITFSIVVFFLTSWQKNETELFRLGKKVEVKVLTVQSLA